MSHIWTFSPVSKQLLERCLNSATHPDESNKWLQKFGPKNLSLIKKVEETIVLNDSPKIEDIPTVPETQDENILQTIEEFLDPDISLLSKFGYFAEKCTKTPKLLTKLAEILPANTAEELFQHIFDTDDLQMEFLEQFYTKFLVHYIKRDNSRFCTDVLLKTYYKYPQYLKIAIELLLKDLSLQNNVINDFILNSSPNVQTEFLNMLNDIEFSSEEFLYNLFNIYTAYKTCNKTDNIQTFILSCLKNHSIFCSNDKNYGKLMLAFLQHEKCLKRDIVSKIVGELIEEHKSPFRRPCLLILKEIKEGSC